MKNREHFSFSESYRLCEETLKYVYISSAVFPVRFFCSSLDSADCVSVKASSETLGESAVTEKESSLSESDCVDGTKPAGTDVAPNSRDPVADEAAVVADESLSSETSKFTRTISPPTLGTLRNCFSWSGSLGDFSRTSSPSPSAALQQFRRRTDPPTTLPDRREVSSMSQSRSDESGDEAPPSRLAAWSPQSQESTALSPHSLNASKLSQPSSKDSDSEVSYVMKPLFSNPYVRENRVLDNWRNPAYILEIIGCLNFLF